MVRGTGSHQSKQVSEDSNPFHHLQGAPQKKLRIFKGILKNPAPKDIVTTSVKQ